MKKEIVNKTVSFNIVDPDQKLMLEYVQSRPNFSGYIKRLIQRDMDGVMLIKSGMAAPITPNFEKEEEAVKFNPDDMF